jgi:hypothetical protein
MGRPENRVVPKPLRMCARRASAALPLPWSFTCPDEAVPEDDDGDKATGEDENEAEDADEVSLWNASQDSFSAVSTTRNTGVGAGVNVGAVLGSCGRRRRRECDYRRA